MTAPSVALVLVSHSRALAQGLVELAAQMAPDVLLVPAGGTDDGRLGTGFDRVTNALADALDGGGSAVVLTDLGSALLTTESVLELAEPDVAARVRVVDAPFVEGAVEAAVAAQAGADVDRVAEAARRAGAAFGAPGEAPSRTGEGPGAGAAAGRGVDAPGVAAGAAGAAGDTAGDGAPTGAGGEHPRLHDRGHGGTTARGTAVLRNRLGLHARPAAQVARTAGAFASTIAVNGADARSVLSLVALGAVGGQQLLVTAAGPDAAQAVRAVVAELEQGFGEA